MLQIGYSTHFKKRRRRIDAAAKDAFDKRLTLFLQEPFHTLLGNHALKGKWKGYRSINVTGDWRAIFKMLDADTAYFVEIGTHHDLYDS